MPPQPRQYVCPRAPAPPSLDGRIEDPVWELAPWTEDFVDIEGEDHPAARLRTRVKMLWDADSFYVAAELEEPDVWATLREENTVIYQDNDFEVFVDPDGDHHNYREFEINAFNTMWNLFLRRPYRDEAELSREENVQYLTDTGIHSAVHVRGPLNDPSTPNRGWTVEVAFPWQTFFKCNAPSCPPKPGDQWRVNFSRVEWDVEARDGAYHKIHGKPEHNWVWSPQGEIAMHLPEHWGIVQFEETCGPNQHFREDPTLPMRQLLMQVYYRQQAYRKTHGFWARNLQELDFQQPGLHLEMTDTGWLSCLTQNGHSLTINHLSCLRPA
jgi:hypothetical protein